MRDLAQRLPGNGIRLTGDNEFGRKLRSACTQLSQADSDDDDDELLNSAARELLSPAREMGQTLADATSTAEDAARKAKADADRAADKLALQQQAHDEAVTRLANARKRHQTALSRLDRDLLGLPVTARQAIPVSALTITPSHIDTARQVITEGHEQLTALQQRRDTATRELTKLATTQRQLDQRRNREVSVPLQKLATYLERWQDVIQQAVNVLPDSHLLPVMPARPAAITTEDIGSYAAALTEAESTARGSLSRAATAVGEEAVSQSQKLDAAAAGLRAGQRGIPAVALAEGQQLLEPAALDPVVAAEANARAAAARHRTEEQTAQGQIQLAASSTLL